MGGGGMSLMSRSSISGGGGKLEMSKKVPQDGQKDEPGAMFSPQLQSNK
jgi:hypothetical protein